MRIVVCVKQVPDTETKIRINSDGQGIDTNGIKWVMNPYDEFAVEEALKLKAGNAGATVTIVSLGPKKRIIDTIRTGLAMGADDGIAIDGPDNLDYFATAKALAKCLQQEGTFDLIFTGKLAIDNNGASVSQALAEFLQIPHTTVVTKFEGGDGQWVVEREVEGGKKEILQLNGPAVIGANKGLNTPRYASLPGIMKAKKKPLKEVEMSSLDLSDGDARSNFVNYQLPPEKPPVRLIDGDVSVQVAELVKSLREEAKVI